MWRTIKLILGFIISKIPLPIKLLLLIILFIAVVSLSIWLFVNGSVLMPVASPLLLLLGIICFFKKKIIIGILFCLLAGTFIYGSYTLYDGHHRIWDNQEGEF